MSRPAEKTVLQAVSAAGFLLCVAVALWGWQTGVLTSQERLEALVGKIPGLLSLKVNRGVMPGGYDLCLLGQYESLDALKGYRDHPLHKEVQQFVHKVIAERVSCDFEE